MDLRQLERPVHVPRRELRNEEVAVLLAERPRVTVRSRPLNLARTEHRRRQRVEVAEGGLGAGRWLWGTRPLGEGRL